MPLDPEPLVDATPDHSRLYRAVGAVDLHMHLFVPESPSTLTPGIVFFFGGGWVGGTPAQFYPHCRHLARRGMLAAAAEYRVESRHGTPPSACVEDGKAALRYLRRHAAEWNLDPQRLAAGGGSAGGHVAAAAAHCPGFDGDDDTAVKARPDALALFNPVFDNGPDGWGHDRVKEYWRQISPLHNIGANPPPTAVFLGTEDPLIPVATAESYRDRMQQAGGRCDLHLYEGRAHGFFNCRRRESGEINPDFVQTLQTTDAFLVSLGYLSA